MTLDDAELVREIVWDLEAIKVCLVRPTAHILAQGFVWYEHPFEFMFWVDEADALDKGYPLSNKARQELERIVIIMELL